MTDSTDISTTALQRLYSSDRGAKAAFEYFAQRQKASSKTTVDSLLSSLGRDVSRGDVLDLFKHLEAAGCGTFVVGRKGHPSRFEWAVRLIDVGRLASGEPIKVELITESERAQEGEGEDTGRLLEHRYRLRKELELRFDLPENLTPAEAARVADFIRTLPFS